MLDDGRTENHWDCDLGLLYEGVRHDVSVIVDGIQDYLRDVNEALILRIASAWTARLTCCVSMGMPCTR